ncbi:hypothetical protein P5808_21660 [Bacillus cereus]|nr:hypothetical protein [Bacillus cereus]MDF9506801.1 hypothetical protein [Bacillus cereus]MDF9596613.1 hypothetical protein [Bacillus cereus]MDF9610213.1 hypothetical protein [Bacillus cereus]MDF9661115.1 hypothetical protein [Bacillus cereus]
MHWFYQSDIVREILNYIYGIGISGPAGWAIGAGVGAVWLGAQAAAGCL